MNTVASEGAAVRAGSRPGTRTSTLRFDALATALGVWTVSGLYLDGWAHTHGRVDQSVVTPWHGVLYSGFLALAALHAVTYLRNRAAGLSTREAMPAGYGLSLLGIPLFLAGGVGDTAWHMTLGIEIGVDALYSPTHLVLAVGGLLMITGPVRAAWGRGSTSPGWASAVPLVISLTAAFSVLTFFVQVMHPLTQRAAEGIEPGNRLFFARQSMGVAGVLVTSMVLVGMILIALEQHDLPFGSLTFLFTVNAWAMSFLTNGFPMALVLAAAASGLIADVMARRVTQGKASAQVFGFLVPATYFLFYFVALLAASRVWWTVHLWMGTPVLAGIAGWMVAYAMSSARRAPVT